MIMPVEMRNGLQDARPAAGSPKLDLKAAEAFSTVLAHELVREILPDFGAAEGVDSGLFDHWSGVMGQELAKVLAEQDVFGFAARGSKIDVL